MRAFDYSGLAGQAWPQGLEDALDKVRRLQALLAEGARARSRLAVLNEEQALVTCAVDSCAIDGREVDGRRLFGIGFGIMEPASLEEQEALGMLEAMQDILVRHASMDVSAQTILALHRIMEGHARPSQAGRFRRRPNSLARDWQGREGMARVETLEPEDVPEAMEILCQAWNRASARSDVDGVMLAGFAVVDFLCIAPFARRNGRMSRLLTMLLLCKAGHAPLACALTASVQRRFQSMRMCWPLPAQAGARASACRCSLPEPSSRCLPRPARRAAACARCWTARWRPLPRTSRLCSAAWARRAGRLPMPS